MVVKVVYGRRKIKVGSMQWRCDRNVACRRDGCRNSGVRERRGLKDVVTKVQKGMLHWLGHLQRMNDRRLKKQIYRAIVCGGKVGQGQLRQFYHQSILVAY
ncbi:hypothetical protein EVAR_43526_1 [Eumeta japonica]|uniref:Uncharacterized protein n=1 Tax=Eumeta variegata TaxID=151549 RepID=A0A4C1WCI6_EUMVA|nr:hypothetical protein EVAR_43526_1 [Eumeta japonica]